MQKYLFTLIFFATFASYVFAQTASSVSTHLNDKIDIGGRKLRINCLGEGSPTVIIEAGFSDAPVENFYWLKIMLDVAANKKNKVCTYDRAGLGSSDPVPTDSRTSQDVVNDLHALLTNANIKAPYVLVGHSMGGFHSLLYAHQYQDEVAGMVLVDAVHPEQYIQELATLPPETSNEAKGIHELREFLSNLETTNNHEKFNHEASIAQLQSIDSFRDLPLTVLTQNPTCSIEPTLSSKVSDELQIVWQRLQVDLASLSSNSTHIIAKTACHDIQRDEPQLVIDAVLTMVETIQQSK